MNKTRKRIILFKNIVSCREISDANIDITDKDVVEEYYLHMKPNKYLLSQCFEEKKFLELMILNRPMGLFTGKIFYNEIPDISKDTLIKLADYVSLSNLMCFKNCDIDVILSKQEKNMNYVLQKMIFKEEDLYKILDHVHVSTILAHQKVSMDFIRKNIDGVNFSKIAKHQKLSEDFINEHIDKIDFSLIMEYQDVSKEFYTTHFNKVINYMSKRKKKVSSNKNNFIPMEDYL